MIDHCTWWPEYIGQTYIGGCCAMHDATTKGWLDFASHINLGSCIAHTAAGPFWGIVMTAGLMGGGWLYALSNLLRRWRR